MKKSYICISGAIVISLIFFTYRQIRPRFVPISETRCWGKLSVGDRVEGTAILHLFKDNSAFIKNERCKSEVLFVNEGASSNLIGVLNQKIDRYPNAIGIHLRVRVRGKIYKNKYMEKMFISAELKKIEKIQRSNMVVVDLENLLKYHSTD